MTDYLGIYKAHAVTLPGIDLMLASAKADGRPDLMAWCLDVREAELAAMKEALRGAWDPISQTFEQMVGGVEVPPQDRCHD